MINFGGGGDGGGSAHYLINNLTFILINILILFNWCVCSWIFTHLIWMLFGELGGAMGFYTVAINGSILF